MTAMGLRRWVAAVAMMLAAHAAWAQSGWEQPASALTEQIAAVMGPGQARMTLRNLSSVSNDEIPAIRKVLVQDLKARGITVSGAESANVLRVTLSETARERLWVAEIVEGNVTQVAMVHAEPDEATMQASASESMVLHKERYLGPHELTGLPTYPLNEPLLAMVETRHGLVVLKQNSLLIFVRTIDGWDAAKGFDLGAPQTLPRDPRGVLAATKDADGFVAYAAGKSCTADFTPPATPDPPPGEGWTLQCHPSDDPWPIRQSGGIEGPTEIKAFYNSARNYFTGVLDPGAGVDLPPYYSAALLARTSGDAILLSGIGGKVQIAERGLLKPVGGTRDWGSDFALLHSRCGSETQIVVSESGEAPQDSLRAYELPDLEAIPASAPLAMDGTVTALWTAQDFNGVFAVVRNTKGEYEVDRVTALCN